ncbi:MAG TPA: TolC family protein [Acidobacteriaceae bacterium]|nr:TolC family protein [Acidobacteriaceae bacterium]
MYKGLVLAMWFCVSPLWAQKTPAPELLQGVASRPALKLEDFLAMADRDNPTLRQAEAMVRRSEAQARQAALYPNPSVGYEGDQIRGGSYGGGEQGGFVQQTIVLGGKLGLRRDVFEQQKQSDQIAAQAQVVRVHNDVTQTFYDALSAQQMVLVRGRLLGLAKDAVETARQLANVGQADAPDVLQTEVEAEQAALDYTDAQRQFLEKFKALASLAGDPTMQVAPLDAALDTLPDIDAAHMVDTIVQQAPTVKEAQQQVAVAEARLKDARREVVPDLQLRAGEQENLEALPEAPGRKTGAQSFASVGVELPLWNRNQGNVRAAEAEIELARQEITRVQLSLRQQAEALEQNYLSARLEAEQYRTALLPRARRAYQLYLDKYQKMAQAYPQVLVSQRTLFELEARYIDSLDRTWQNAIALQNFTLQGGLEKPVTDTPR